MKDANTHTETPAGEDADAAAARPAPPAGRSAAGEEDAGRPLFDATADQRVPLTLVIEGEEYDATLILKPQSDSDITRYVKKCEEASDASDGEEDTLEARMRASLAAVEVLFNSLAGDIEGVGEEGEQKPEDWKDQLFTAEDKSAILDEALFGFEYLPPKRAEPRKRPRWGADLRNQTTRVAFPFEGRMVPTSHTLKKASAAVFSEALRLISSGGGARGSDAHMLKFAEMYDQHHVAHEGYRGEVPRLHRANVFILHVTRQKASVRKN